MKTLNGRYQENDSIKLDLGAVTLHGVIHQVRGPMLEIKTELGMLVMGGTDSRIVTDETDLVAVYRAAKAGA